jgi:hypothetical protein
MRPPIKEPATRKIRRCLRAPLVPSPAIAERGAEADLEGEGDGLRLPEGSRNQVRNLARRKGDEFLAGSRVAFHWHGEDVVQHQVDAIEERGVWPHRVFPCQLLPQVRWNGVGCKVVAEVRDVSAALAKSGVGERGVLQTKGSRNIEELRLHSDPNARTDGELAGVEVALDDDVIEPLHAVLALGGETSDARDGRRDMRGIRSLSVQREHGFERLVARDALLLEILGGIAAAKDVFDKDDRAYSQRGSAEQIEHLLDQGASGDMGLPE